MNVNLNEHLWVEKYRPNVIEDIILPQRTKEEVRGIIKDGKVPNLLFYGQAGCGKTTLAKVIAKETKSDWIIINGSNERGIDTIREKVVGFASTASLSGNNHKIVIIDEGDRLSTLAAEALKSEIEKFSKSTSFIFTANHPNRIIDPLLSRLVGVDFTPKKDEIEQLQAEFFMRICSILDNESVKYDENVLIEVIQKFFPDNRRILGELQQYSRASNEINVGMLMYMDNINSQTLIESIRKKKFKDVAQWAADNSNNDTTIIYEQLYKELKKVVQPQSIPDMIMTLEEYQRYDSIVASKELHLAALGVSLMTTLEFK